MDRVCDRTPFTRLKCVRNLFYYNGYNLVIKSRYSSQRASFGGAGSHLAQVHKSGVYSVYQVQNVHRKYNTLSGL